MQHYFQFSVTETIYVKEDLSVTETIFVIEDIDMCFYYCKAYLRANPVQPAHDLFHGMAGF